MNNEPTASALTDSQIVERLATEVMGWTRKQPYEDVAGYRWSPSWQKNNSFKCWTAEWNPLTDWNHTAQILNRCVELGMKWGMDIKEIADQKAICLKALSALDTLKV